MKAAVLRKLGVISVEDMETPKAGIGEVLVKVSYCGICGSDLHRFCCTTSDDIIMGGHEFSRGYLRDRSWSTGLVHWPAGDTDSIRSLLAVLCLHSRDTVLVPER